MSGHFTQIIDVLWDPSKMFSKGLTLSMDTL